MIPSLSSPAAACALSCWGRSAQRTRSLLWVAKASCPFQSEGVTVNLTVEDVVLVVEQERLGDEGRQSERVEVATPVMVPQPGNGVGYTDGK